MKDCTREEMVALLEPIRAANGWTQGDMDKAIHIYADTYKVSSRSLLYQVWLHGPFRGYMSIRHQSVGCRSLYQELVQEMGKALQPNIRHHQTEDQPTHKWRGFGVSSPKGD